MYIGEVLGNLACIKKDDKLKGFGLKVIRLYENKLPSRVIVAGDNGMAPGNGDFVRLCRTGNIDYTIIGFADGYLTPYGVADNNEHRTKEIYYD